MEPLSRPLPSSSRADRTRAWIEWFGVGRLLAAAIATVVVCAGAYWLLRMPPPPTEATLPRATAVTAVQSTAVPTTDRSAVTVHVAGSVLEPGVYELLPGARVRDAVAAAGGPTENADWNVVNLAALAIDGSRVYVPAVGEDLPAEPAVGADAVLGAPGPVDVNRATVPELERLPGVGPATAAAIVTDRERNGPFVTVDDLERVPGIGPAKLAALRDLVAT